MDIWIISIFQLLWKILLWTLANKYLDFSFPSLFFQYIPRNETARSMVILCLALWVIARFFPQWLHHLTFPPVMHNSFNFSASLSALVIFFFFYDHPSRCKVITDDFDYTLMTLMLSIFSCVYLKFVYLLWRNV